MPAKSSIRRAARVYDLFIMLTIALIIYYLSKPGDFFYSKRMLFCCTSFFYLFIYCPVLDKNGGTFGKLATNIRVVSVSPFNENISWFQTYKRLILINWCIVVGLILETIIHFGVFDIDCFWDNEIEDYRCISLIQLISSLSLIFGVFWATNYASPNLNVRKGKNFLFQDITITINKGQGMHDLISGTAVITKKDVDGESITSFKFKKPQQLISILQYGAGDLHQGEI